MNHFTLLFVVHNISLIQGKNGQEAGIEGKQRSIRDTEKKFREFLKKLHNKLIFTVALSFVSSASFDSIFSSIADFSPDTFIDEFHEIKLCNIRKSLNFFVEVV